MAVLRFQTNNYLADVDALGELLFKKGIEFYKIWKDGDSIAVDVEDELSGVVEESFQSYRQPNA